MIGKKFIISLIMQICSCFNWGEPIELDSDSESFSESENDVINFEMIDYTDEFFESGDKECDYPLVWCNGECVDISSDRYNCGSCGYICEEVENSSPVCVGGSCKFVCFDNYRDLDGIASNGCECALTNDGIETCDGIDNDCDGQKDEDFECIMGETEFCEAYGSCAGERRCSLECFWEDCFNVLWECQPVGITEVRPCGEGNCGIQMRACSSGCRWSSWGECELASSFQCWPGEVARCGRNCGETTCQDDCTWSNDCVPLPTTECFPWEERDCGTCGSQHCNPDCLWGVCFDPCV